jgi:hypothetical protein
VDKPEFPEIEKAFDWYHTPANVKARLEILGQPGLYELDEPLDLSGPQWVGVVGDIAVEGGLFEDVQYTQELWGEQWIDPKLKGGAPGTWDWNSGAMVDPFSEVMKGDMSVQEFLDWAQKNWEESYEL